MGHEARWSATPATRCWPSPSLLLWRWRCCRCVPRQVSADSVGARSSPRADSWRLTVLGGSAMPVSDGMAASLSAEACCHWQRLFPKVFCRCYQTTWTPWPPLIFRHASSSATGRIKAASVSDQRRFALRYCFYAWRSLPRPGLGLGLCRLPTYLGAANSQLAASTATTGVQILASLCTAGDLRPAWPAGCSPSSSCWPA